MIKKHNLLKTFKIHCILTFVSTLLLAGCITTDNALLKKLTDNPDVISPNTNPAAVEALSTRHFNASKDNVFAASISALQNVGYEINAVYNNAGIIIARRDPIDITIFVTSAETGSSNVRVTIVDAQFRGEYVYTTSKRVVTKHSSEQYIRLELSSPALYQELFTYIEQSLFIGENSNAIF